MSAIQMLPTLVTVVIWTGAIGGMTLLLLLFATLAQRDLRIWPTPGEKSWQSYVFWPLFRGLNALCVVAAVLTWPGGLIGLPIWLRIAAVLAGVASVATFVTAFRLLGRDNSYGAADGLVTGGIYQWSRNPQNAMLMVVYTCLAIAADAWAVYLLCALMVAVYFVMVLCEEPWLADSYGDRYRAYCREVPRFFAFRRLFAGAIVPPGNRR